MSDFTFEIYSLIFHDYNMNSCVKKISRLGLPDKFSQHYGNQEALLDLVGLTKENLYSTMKQKLENLK